MDKPSKPKAVKFNASLPFAPRPPYPDIFNERIPVLHAFQLAIGNYLYGERQRKEKNPWGSFFWRKGLHRLAAFNAVECGVFTGSSLVACAQLANDSGIPFHLVGLDTFSGLPPLSENDKRLAPEGAAYLEKTLFTETSVEAVQQRLDAAGVSRQQVTLLPGLFSDTLPALAQKHYHFVNIDCDLYEPHLDCLAYFYPRMVRGGVIFFDDYNSMNYPMAGQAIDDFMADKPERLAQLRYGDDAPNRTKAYMVKF